MYAWLQELLNNPTFMPHGHCYLWTPALLNMYIVAESLIAVSYFAIPLGLVHFANRRTDFPYKSLLWLFGAFITLCGLTHVADLWNIWNSSYWAEAWIKLITGVVSAFTAITLFPLIPQALKLRSPDEWEAANATLRAKVQELEQTQSALAESEQRYRLLVETAREGIWVLDNAGNTVFANERLGELLGRRPQAMLGQSLLDFVEPEQREAVATQLAARQQALAATGSGDDLQTFRFRRDDGSALYTIFATSVVQDRQGERGTLAVVTDITEREKIARELSQLTAKLERLVAERTEALTQANQILLRESAERGQAQAHLQAVLNAAADGIIVADVQGKILTTNPAVEKIFQYRASEVIGQPLSLLMPEPFRHEHDSYIHNYLHTGRAKVIGIGREVMGLRRDGKEFPLDLAVGVVRQNDSMQFVGIVRDISERQAAQQQILSLNEQLSRTNGELQSQIKERELVWRDLDSAHAKLEQTLAELRTQSENISLLNEMSELLQAAITVEEAGAILQHYCNRLFAADAGNLLLVDSETQKLAQVFTWGPDDECEHEFEHQRCWALRQAKPYPITTLQRSLRCAHLHLPEGREALCLPLFGQGEALGLLVLRDGQALAEIVVFSDEREYRSWLMAFAEQVSLALANLRLRERLRDEAIRDPLSGLFNRRHLNQELLRLWAAMALNDTPLAMLMIDVDHFKQVNDSHGHDVGDLVLCEIARRLQRNSRPGDVLARFGGEEFIVVLPGTELSIAQRRASDICSEIARFPIRLMTGPELKVSVSIGVAAGRRSDDGVDVAQLLSRADQALYNAKEAGRNRVEVYQ